ncbi:MAG TPA: peptidase inhibitor family I36 protein [Iamia sp.]|jgi:hypothetical protein|nr:peptidase inhibitor family I36 protein [Iamia sp.]
MRKNKKITTLLGAAAILVMMALVAPTPAQAATGFARCPAGKFCIFTDTGGNGVMATFDVADGNLGDGVGPQGMNDNVESVFNNTGGQLWGTAKNPGYVCACETYDPGFKGRVRDALFNEISSLCRRSAGGTTCT